MFLQKQDDAFHRFRKVIMDIYMIKDINLIGPDKPSALDPGIRKMKVPFLSKKEDSSIGGDEFSLYRNKNPESFKFFFMQVFSLSFHLLANL